MKTLIKFLALFIMITGILSLPLIVSAGNNANDTEDVLYEKAENYVEEQMKQYHVPSLSLGIVKKDKNETKIHLKGFGKNITPQTPFIIGSVSKSFTALAVMQLVERDKIELDNTIDNYIPGFKAKYQSKDQSITVRQLLQHTSGIKPFYDGMADTDVTIEQLVRSKLNNTKLDTLPGTFQNYSNANYIILGEIIQKVSGQSYQDYMNENIFIPLEMKHSYFSKEDAEKNGLATGHQKWFGYPVKADLPYYEYSIPMGEIISCAEDMSHYVSALLNNGMYNKVSILSKEGVKELFNTQVQEEYVPAGATGTVSYYGFGWRIVYNNDDLVMIQHTGETGNYHANVVIKPTEGIGIVELDSLGGEMTPMSIGLGAAEIMAGNQPKKSHFLNYVFIGEIVCVILIILLLALSILRLRKWSLRIEKSRRRFLFEILIAIAINLVVPIYLILTITILEANLTASMLVFPDMIWTILVVSVTLLLIGVAKLIVTIHYFKKQRE